jgi:hypothetical protein
VYFLREAKIYTRTVHYKDVYMRYVCEFSQEEDQCQYASELRCNNFPTCMTDILEFHDTQGSPGVTADSVPPRIVSPSDTIR